MKKTVFICLTWLLIHGVTAQEITTMGSDFWLAFLPVFDTTQVFDYHIGVVCERSCSVTMSNPISGWTHTMQVPPNQMVVYDIAGMERDQFRQEGSGVIFNKGMHITATDTVQVYCFNQPYAITDGSIVLPTAALGNEYVVHTYPQDVSQHDFSAGAFSILAVEDSTVVDILFADNAMGGFHAGDTITVMLNAGQIYQVKGVSGVNNDLTGTIVRTRDCDGQVAVFSGNSRAYVPVSGISSDMLTHQLYPTRSWGTRFVTAPEPLHHHDNIRVTALLDNTHLYVGSRLVATLAAYHTYEFDITQGIYFHTDKPVEAFQFFRGRVLTGQCMDYGDVSMMAVQPMQQMTKKSIFGSFSVRTRCGTTHYYAVVMLPTDDTSMLRLDGNAVDNFEVIAGSDYSVASIAVSSESHILSTEGSGFVGYACGLGENWESYSFSLGGKASITYAPVLHIIDTAGCYRVVYDDVTYTESGEYYVNYHCDTATLLRVNILHGYQHFDEVNACDSITWHGRRFYDTGIYYDTVPTTEGCDSVYKLLLYHHYPSIQTDHLSSCQPVEWRGRIIDSTGVYCDTVPQLDMCDSIFYLYFTRIAASQVYDTVEQCGSGYLWIDTLLTASGSYQRHFTTAEGCDSIRHLLLTLYPEYDTTYQVVIHDTSSYMWVDSVTYRTPTTQTLALVTLHGCDSILRLDLQVVEDTYDPNIWIPNIFTPGEEGNCEFRIYSQRVAEMKVSIFNRQGLWVYSFDGLSGSWDGTHNGSPCPEGVYVYHITYTPFNSNNRMAPITGAVTLLR